MAINPKNHQGYNLESIAEEKARNPQAFERAKKIEGAIVQWEQDGRRGHLPDYLNAHGVWDNNLKNADLSPEGIRDLKAMAQNYRIMSDFYDSVMNPPKPDVRLEETQKAQIESAKRFRDSIPAYAKALMAKPERAAREGLAREMVSLDRQANRRGLLYGGMRQKARAETRQKSAADLATKRSEINSSLYDYADTMDKQAVNTGLGMAGLAQDVSRTQQNLDVAALERILKRDTQEQEATSDLLGSLGGTIGKVAGSK